LMAALEENDAFPATNPTTNKKTPLYLRLENNYIEPSAIKAKIDSGVIKTIAKGTSLSGDTKVHLLRQRPDDKYQQKEGLPPAAEEVAPVTKEIWDMKASKGTGKGKGGFDVPWWQIEEAVAWLGPAEQAVLANELMAAYGAGSLPPAWGASKGSWSASKGSSPYGGGSKGGLSETDTMAKLHKHLTYLNGRGGFNNQINSDEVKKAAQGVDWQTMIPVLNDVENKKDQIKDPTAFITAGLKKNGGGGFKGASQSSQTQWQPKGQGKSDAQPQGKAQWNAQPQSKGQWNTQSQGKGQWNNLAQGKAQWNQPKAAPAWAAAVKKEAIPAWGATVAKAGAQKVPLKPGIVAGTGPGSKGSAVDRSRTPVGRTATKPPEQPKTAPTKPKPPHPWTEEMSEEYKIPYFWNPVTLESSWEMPKA